jgi:hypothetical protein
MANAFFGEASAEVDGKVWTARLDFNALCEYEDATGRDAMADFQSFETGKVRPKVMRDIVHALLAHHHPGVTLQEAGVVMSKAPEILERTFTAAMPEADEGNVEAAGKKPAA